jgi:hypothetical protein
LRFSWFIVLQTLWLLVLARPAQAQEPMKVYTIGEKELGTDLTPYIYYYEDRFSKRTLSQLTQPKFNKRWTLNTKRNLGFGYSKSAYWLRVALSNPTDQDRNIAIRIDYPMLDEISFFDAGENGYVETLSGDSEPFERLCSAGHDPGG